MPPKKSAAGEGNGELPTSTFPFHVGDEVEMKSLESGYRGAWFRVQIMKLRLDRKGNLFCVVLYKDYADESQEEISAFEKDPVSNEMILMVRPLPPPLVKESKFNKSVHTKMCVVYRDQWEVGDLVDWWYHHCWWSAKVISVVGDGRFQLVCPAPPAGEGGVYLANSRDLRPSLKWSIAAQWTAPPSKEIGKIPCARIVWLLDSEEAAGFSIPTQEKKRRRLKVMGIISPTFESQESTEVVARNPGMEVRQKRGRPRKVDGQEGAVKKKRRPIVIKIIHPRQDTNYEKVDPNSKNQFENEKVQSAKKQEDAFRIQGPNGNSRGLKEAHRLMTELLPEAENRQHIKQVFNTPMEKKSEGGESQGNKFGKAVLAKRRLDGKTQDVQQKKAVTSTVGNAKVTLEPQLLNGRSVNHKRQKLEHKTTMLERENEEECMVKRTMEDQHHDCKKQQELKKKVHEPQEACVNVKAKLEQPKAQKQKKIRESKLNVETMRMAQVGDVVVTTVCDLVPKEVIVPRLDVPKDINKIIADQIPNQKSSCRGLLQVQAPESKLVSTCASVRTVIAQEDCKAVQAYKEALDLKVLNAYEEAFIDINSEDKKSCSYQDPLVPNAHTEHIFSEGEERLRPQDLSVVRAYEEAFIEDICPAGSKSGLGQNLCVDSKLDRSPDFAVSGDGTNMVNAQVGSSCPGVFSRVTKTASSLQDRHMEKVLNVNTFMSHDLLIGEEASSFDTISVGGSPNSSSGQMANFSAGDLKVAVSASDVSLGVKEEDSGSSSELRSSRDKHCRDRTICGINARQDVKTKSEKIDKNDLSSSLRKKITKPVVKRKVSLSRKLIEQAMREVSAKRRRDCKSTL